MAAAVVRVLSLASTAQTTASLSLNLFLLDYPVCTENFIRIDPAPEKAWASSAN
jgi:hypothetical protein